ncbi:MAG TPA: class I SAM-dependent methyltransferase [Candidatus Obscuribacterales bacterium]
MFDKSAQLYDLFYAGKDYAGEAQKLQAIIRERKRSEGSAMLDVACGTGGHAEFFKRLYELDGLDLDKQLLERARDRHPEIELHQGDMIDFQLSKRFDVIVCLFSAIGYVRTADNLHRAIANMCGHLKPGGVLIVEPWFDADTYYPGMAHAAFVDTPSLKACRMNVSRIEGGLSIIEFHYLVAAENETVSHFTERHELGLFSKDEHIQAFRKAGLEVSYDQAGLTGRGLYIGVKTVTDRQSHQDAHGGKRTHA